MCKAPAHMARALVTAEQHMAIAENKGQGPRAVRAASRTPSRDKSRRLTVKRAALGPMGKLEDFIPFKLAVVANRLSQSIGRLFETRFNIQVPEWRILMTLYAYDDLVFNEVVERTSMDKARVSRAQHRLVDLGLIDSINDPTDGRKVILSLTRKGEKMCCDILPQAAEREAWYLAALDHAEHRQLDVILDKLMKRSQEA
jgi:DNA-binding MarR family transcriptional regulator